MMDRREVIQKGAMLAAGALVAGRADAQEAGGAKFFPGFKPFKVKTTGAEINGVIGGSGPPILLLHGAPQSHITWRLVAPKLAATRTVIVPDLRGYGDSSKPPDGENHVNYSKRAMEEQDGRAGAADHPVDLRAGRLHGEGLEAGEELRAAGVLGVRASGHQRTCRQQRTLLNEFATIDHRASQ